MAKDVVHIQLSISSRIKLVIKLIDLIPMLYFGFTTQAKSDSNYLLSVWEYMSTGTYEFSILCIGIVVKNHIIALY